MVWKQRMYAFLLRRVLGPYLSTESLQQLHNSIEVSLQEGKFSLNDIELNAAYLSSKQSKGTIHHVKIRKLQIMLSLREKQEEESSSVTWRAMNLGRDGAGVSLQAHVEIDGVEIHVGPPVATEEAPSPPPSPPKKTEETMSSAASSLLSSYIDAALASLRLAVDLKNVKIRLSGGNAQSIDLDLSYARYHDKESQGVEMHKAIDFSGISVQTCADEKNELIAKLDGGGQVSLQAKNVGSEDRLQQDVSLSLYRRINLSVGESSLRCILNVVDDFSDPSESSQSFPFSPLERSEYFDPPPEFLEEDARDVETMKGIIEQQYAEARQFAERNEVRGGILVQDGDTMSFDAFFDANELSFSTYRETLAESILSKGVADVDGDDFVHTHLKLYLGEFRVKVAFPKIHADLPSEYMLLTCNDVNVSSSLSGRCSEVHLSMLQIQAETSELTQDGRPEIKPLLTFDQENNPSNVVSASPCLDLEWRKDGEAGKSLDIHLQALTIHCNQQTISKCAALSKSVRPERGESVQFEPEPARPETRMSVLVSTVTLLVPVYRVPDATFERLFDRCGYTMEDQELPRVPSVGLTLEDVAYRTLDSSPDNIGDGATGQKISCLRALVFVSAPHAEDPSILHRMDVLALSGHVPLSVAYTKNFPAARCPSEGERIFPKVPAISSFKAIEEEDEDMDHSGRGEIVNSLRSPDPQPALLREASLCHQALEVVIPDITVELSKGETESLKEILRGISPEKPETDDETENESAPKSNQRAIALAVRIDQITTCVHADRDSFSFKIIGYGWKAFAALKGSKVSCARLMMHTMDVYTAKKLIYRDSGSMKPAGISIHDRCDAIRQRTVRNASTKATPILYRSQLFPPLSPESPAILLDLINRSDDFCAEWNVHVSVYNMTHRYDIESAWHTYLKEFLQSENQESDNKTGEESQAPKSTLTRVFVTFADCNVDYTSAEYFDRASRSILRVSDIRFSSTIISPQQPAQAFKLSIVDASFLIGNRRHPYNNENACLARSVTILGPQQLDLANSQVPAPNLHQMNLVTMLTLDSLVASISLSSEGKQSYMRGHGLRDPNVEAQLTLGYLCLYGCKDSFECFADTVGDVSLKLTGLTSEKIEAMKEKALIKNVDDSDSSEDKYFDSNAGELDLETATGPEKNDSSADTTMIGTIDQNDRELRAATSSDAFELDGYDWTTIDHEWSKDDLPAGEEQVARWFDDGLRESPTQSTIGSTPRPQRSRKLQLISHYIHVKPTLDPLAEGDMDAARHAGTSSPPTVNVRTLVRDLKVRCRFFDGYDWPQDVKKSNQPAQRNYAFIIDNTLDKVDDTEKEQKATEQKDSSHGGDRKKVLMGALLDSETPSSGSGSTFHKMPLPEERGLILMDKAEQRRLARKVNCFLQVSLAGVKLRMDSFEETANHRLASCMDLRMEDFFIAETISNSQPTKMLGEWLNDIEHPRDTKHGLVMLRMCTWKPTSPVTEDNKIANDEAEAVLEFLPLRCYVDQRAVRFMRAFFTSGEEAKEKSWASHLSEIPPPVFKSFRIKPCKLKVNYTPERVDVPALRDGSIVELVNLSPLNDMVIMLKAVHLEDKVGFGAVFSELAMSWIRNICSTQLHKFVTNSSPFQPFTSISTGAVDMVVLPWSAVQNGEGVSKALGKGVKSFAGSVVYETLNVTTKLTSFAANQMARFTSSSSQRSAQRPLSQPRGLLDTAEHSFQSIAQGLETANYKIIIIPYREYHRTGTSGAVRSVVRGIPVAVLAPLGGASEALSYTLLGARNQVRPDIRREEEASRKGLSFED